MRYVGGKGRLARRIAAEVLAATSDRNYYFEPFIGGASVFAELAPHFGSAFGGDAMPDVAALWRAALEDGWSPPEVVSRELYAELRAAEPSALRGFVGFGGSFGGKWFGGYAKGGEAHGEPRNHQGESARAVERIKAAVTGSRVTIRHADYSWWPIRSGDVVYCDPPYAGTLGYRTGDFDSARFWEVARGWRTAGATVLVSEYEAPGDWREVAAFDHRNSTGLTSQRFATIERLFV